MDKELIKKYKQEFEYWLTGGELLFMPEGQQAWFDTLRSEIDWSIKGTYVINDNYVQLRIALTEGKQIQYNPLLYCHDRWEDVTNFNPSESSSTRNYRIKPEFSTEFKVGNWIVNSEFPKSPFQVSKDWLDHIINTGRTIGGNTKETGDLKNFSIWQPKAGEWCWFWSETLKTPMLLQFERFCSTNLYKYGVNNERNYQYCEPFLGKLPTALKDM